MSGRRLLFDTLYPDAFSPYFSIERTEPRNFTIKRKLLRHNIPGHWYWLRRL